MSSNLKASCGQLVASGSLSKAEHDQLCKAIDTHDAVMRAAENLRGFDWTGLLKIIPNILGAIIAGTIPGLQPLVPLILGLTPILNILLPIFIPGWQPLPTPTPGPVPTPPDGGGTIPPTPIP